MERGVIQFESHTPPGAEMDDLDPIQVEAYIQALGLPADESPEKILQRRGCLVGTGSNIRPTYAALLLFGRYPQRWVPNATLLAGRFPGAIFSDRYIKQDITGTLPNQIRQAEIFLRDNLRSVVRLIGFSRQETMEYPLEAVRELVVNAVAHRDYNLQGDNVRLNIFSDRLEVSSPGHLPGPVTLENLLDARFSRNAVIAQVLSDLGFVERLGYGLDRVVSVLRENNLPPPRFEEVAGCFKVTLFATLAGEADLQKAISRLSAYQEMDLNPRQQAVLSHLVTHRRITNSTYQDLCPDVHPETLRRDLSDLVSRGILIKIGEKRATYYILK
jgi:ATP-dependent DNA helicase RecG